MNLNYRNEKMALAIAAFWGKPLDKPDWYSINALDTDTPEIFIHSIIGWPYLDEESLTRAMATVKDKHLLVRINSPGGDVISGMTLFNAFANHPGGSTMRIEGQAASIATVVAMAGTKVEAYPNTRWMIHNAWVNASGDHNDLREIADIIEPVSGQMLDIYVGKTKSSKKEMKAMMDKTTYMTAQQAKDKGFIDTILSGKGIKAEFDMSMFANCPECWKGETKENKLTERDLERGIRDVFNLSANKAKAIITGCKKANGEIDDEAAQAGIKELIATMEKNISILKQ